VDYETLLALDPLHAAQESLGLAPNPVVGGEAAAASPDAAASPAAEASPAA
jgi:hypothetical protein